MVNKRQKNSIKNIWMVTREYDGIAGAGGVKDVSKQLADALANKAKKISVILPLYGFMNPEEHGFKPLDITFDVDMDYVGLERQEHVQLWERHKNKVRIYLVDSQRFREKRSIYTYTAEEEAENPANLQGKGHSDYFAMNVLLQKSAIAAMIHLDERPDIIHCQDGHTAILPALTRETEGYRHFFNKTGFVVTIHNAGFGHHQEVGDLPFAQTICGLPSRTIKSSLLDNMFDPFLAAAPHAVLNTVSENYARELQETSDDALTGWLGHHLKSKGIQLAGITNGINPENYNPANPKKMGTFAAFDPLAGKFAGKKKCKHNLLEALNNHKHDHILQFGNLENKDNCPLFTFIGRLSVQKGVDKLVEALEALFHTEDNFQVLALGTGTKDLEGDLVRLTTSAERQGRICVLLGYDPVLANQIYAAGDFFVIPSQYEPCGLTDFLAQLFGNVPIVHHVGGLVKVINGVTGFTYDDHSSAALMASMQKALQVYRNSPQTIKKLQRAAVKHLHENYTWDKVVERYLVLYQEALALAGLTKVNIAHIN